MYLIQVHRACGPCWIGWGDARWPTLRRGDVQWNNAEVMRAAERRAFYLFRLRLSASVKWAIERAMAKAFGWLMRQRRLVRDHEVRLDVSDAMVHQPGCTPRACRSPHPLPFSNGSENFRTGWRGLIPRSRLQLPPAHPF